MKNRLFTALLSGAFALAAFTAQAATYNFSATFNGSTVALDGGSDNPDGVELFAGDSFVISLNAAGNDYWEVLDFVTNAFVPLDFLVEQAGTRFVDISTAWNLDGVFQNGVDEVNQEQFFSHIGAQTWDMGAGTLFDQVVISVSLLGMDAPTILSAGGPDIFFDFGGSLFFRDGPLSGNIDYVAAAVPLPAGIALYLPLLAAGGWVARRRAKAKA